MLERVEVDPRVNWHGGAGDWEGEEDYLVLAVTRFGYLIYCPDFGRFGLGVGVATDEKFYVSTVYELNWNWIDTAHREELWEVQDVLDTEFKTTLPYEAEIEMTAQRKMLLVLVEHKLNIPVYGPEDSGRE